MKLLRSRIAEAELRELYATQGLTMVQVARQLAVAPTTIGRRFRELGICTRPRGPVPGSRSTAPIDWTADLAYAVGLIATDGNLSRKPGRLSIVSNDVDLLDMLRRRLNLTAPIRRHTGGYGARCHRLAWSDRRFYEWLVRIGLTPAKSLTLGPLAVPDGHFVGFLRGCIDGDGSIVVYTDRYHTGKNARYIYDRLYVSLVSASRAFVDWIQMTVRRLLEVQGSIDSQQRQGKRRMWRIRYAKRDSIRLLRSIYYAPDVACLDRKRAIAQRFLQPLGRAAVRPAGRPRVGWLYNGVPPPGAER